MKRRDLEKHLRSHGCYCENQTGPHDGWVNPNTGDVTTIPRHKEINRFTTKQICKDLGVPVVKGA